MAAIQRIPRGEVTFDPRRWDRACVHYPAHTVISVAKSSD